MPEWNSKQKAILVASLGVTYVHAGMRIETAGESFEITTDDLDGLVVEGTLCAGKEHDAKVYAVRPYMRGLVILAAVGHPPIMLSKPDGSEVSAVHNPEERF